jgi:hypothetical protein
MHPKLVVMPAVIIEAIATEVGVSIGCPLTDYVVVATLGLRALVAAAI